MKILKKEKPEGENKGPDLELEEIYKRNIKFFKENMNWLCLDLKDTKKILKMVEDYKIETTNEPHLVVLDRKGNQVFAGINKIQDKGPKAIISWLEGADLSYPEALDPFLNIENNQTFNLVETENGLTIGFDGQQREGSKIIVCALTNSKSKVLRVKEAGEGSFTIHLKEDPS